MGPGLTLQSSPGTSLNNTGISPWDQLTAIGQRNATNRTAAADAASYAAANITNNPVYGGGSTPPPATQSGGSTGGYTSGGGSYGGQSSSAYAAQQAAARATQLANAQTNVNDSMGNILNNFGTNAALNSANAYRGQVDTNLGQLASGQNQINSTRQNAELNRNISVNDLANTLRSGLRSTGVQLGNQNALDSSAAEGAARGYGQYGAQQTNDINGQTNLALTQADQAQSGLDAQAQQMHGSLENQKSSAIQSIQSNLGTYLKQLDDQAQAEGLSPLDYQGRIQNVIDDANKRLGDVDSYFGQQRQLAPYQAIGNEGAAQQAYQAFQNGAVPQNQSLYSFDRTPINGGQGQGAAPTVQLPLYTKRYE
jgi:hypothetical protein